MTTRLLRITGTTVLAGLAAACGGEAPSSAERATPVAVQVTRVAMMELRRPFEAGGTVRARTTATLVSRIVAEVREVRALPGDRVRAGQPIVVLDGRELEANLARAEAAVAAADAMATAAAAGRASAEAALQLATSTHRRVADLREKNAATPHELDEVVAGLLAAQAQAEAARARELEAGRARDAARAAADAARVTATYATLEAPFTGIVTEKLVEPGNMASPGLPLMTVEDTSGFRLEALLDESRATLVAPGDVVEVRLGAAADPSWPGGSQERLRAVTGTVDEVARTLDPGSHSFRIKVTLPADLPLRSGMFGRARFDGPPRRALAVPARSLVRRGQLVSVFAVDAGGQARMRLVNVADVDGNLVEVLAGLDEGETIVLDPPSTMRDGTPVGRDEPPSAAGGAAEGGRR